MALIPILAGLATAAIGARGASKAAKASTHAADKAQEFNQYAFDTARADAAPWMSTGLSGFNALAYGLGVGDQPPGYEMSLTPAARFAMTEGRDIIEGGAAARGNLFSGSTAAGLEDMRGQIALNDRNTQLNYLAGIAGMGQAATAGQASQLSTFGANAGEIAMQRGNAQAAGAIGVTNALADGINTGVALHQYGKTNKLAPDYGWVN